MCHSLWGWHWQLRAPVGRRDTSSDVASLKEVREDVVQLIQDLLSICRSKLIPSIPKLCWRSTPHSACVYAEFACILGMGALAFEKKRKHLEYA